MSRFVRTTDGDLVNLDRLARIYFDTGGASDEVGLILGSDRVHADTEDEVVLAQGPTAAVSKIWDRWPTYARDGADLGAAIRMHHGEEPHR